ncbi:PREDICTED: aquaporin-12-like isoform X1 [Branchiostoma belcheri]|uniref:Aquaporin-12-like isoform X1 n=1 Tax=Branchiostoma belcheri TaxID=7741 RepID=A0A6P4ZLL4_BRABE|nr:PREDICTED: aquaporin-12-like isoform X1 [Branchiostoma belcheri]
MSLVVSLVILVATFVACKVVRVLLKSTVTPTVYGYINEAISAFQVSFCVAENDFIATNYGIYAAASVLPFLLVSYAFSFDGAKTNPCGVFEDFLSGGNKLECLGRLLLELVGATLAPKAAYLLWTIELSPAHALKAQEEVCISVLNTGLVAGMVAEGLATFLTRWGSWKLRDFGVNYDIYLGAALSTCVVLLGASWTGMMFNPALAVSMTYGCKGESIIDHVVVYWIGPLIATALSYYLHFGTVPVLQAEKVKTT